MWNLTSIDAMVLEKKLFEVVKMLFLDTGIGAK